MRVRWHVSANLLGIVLSRDEQGSVVRCSVMWTTGDKRTKVAWHVEDALMRVDDETVNAVRGRCNPSL